jgi:hypothetical protein
LVGSKVDEFLVKHKKVVKSTPAVSVRPAKYDDMNAKMPAYSTRALLPRAGGKCVPIAFRIVLLAVPKFFVQFKSLNS